MRENSVFCNFIVPILSPILQYYRALLNVCVYTLGNIPRTTTYVCKTGNTCDLFTKIVSSKMGTKMRATL